MDELFLDDARYEALIAAILAAKPDLASGQIDRNAIIVALMEDAAIFPARIQEAA